MRPGGTGWKGKKKDIGMSDERRKDRENRNRTEETNGKLSATRSTGVGQIRCCFQKSQLNQQEMQLQREIADLPGFRSEMKEGEKKRERQVENGMFFWKPHVCGLCSVHPAGGEAPSSPTAAPWCSHRPPYLPACPRGRKPPPCPAPQGQFNS